MSCHVVIGPPVPTLAQMRLVKQVAKAATGNPFAIAELAQSAQKATEKAVADAGGPRNLARFVASHAASNAARQMLTDASPTNVWR